jgi:diguanylate cyclase (GGDEF)-like protein
MPAGAFRLDVYTLSVMTLANLALVTLATLFTWIVNRPIAGILAFSGGMFILCIGSLVSIFRHAVPGAEVILVANAMTFSATILIVQGLRRFRGAKPFSLPFVASSYVGFLGIFCYFLFVHNILAGRVAALSSFYAFFCFFAAWAMLRDVPRPDRLVYWPAGIFLAVHGLLMLMRTDVALTGGFGNNVFSPVPVQIACLISLNLVVVSSALSLMTASSLRLRREAEELALYDPLTHLPNRRLFLDRLRQAEQRALATRGQLAVIYLDLDDFKAVNDTMGHQAGDEVLKTVAARLSTVLSAGDCLARIGGDEFIVLLEGIRSRQDVVSVTNRLKSAVESETLIGGWSAVFRVSCGMALFPADGRTAEAVVREADAAMYQSKRDGRHTLAATASDQSQAAAIYARSPSPSLSAKIAS